MITKTALYAIKAMTELSRLPEGELGCAACIAERTGAPANYLSKLLKLLAQQGLLESRKGLGGGFRLARPAEQISLYDIAEPIDHVSRWTACFFGSESCSQTAPCPAHRGWQAVREPYLEFLHSTSLKDMQGNH